MKPFKVNYQPDIDTYLSEKNIRWSHAWGNQVYIYCPDEAALFQIAINYAKWYAAQ